MRKEPFSISTIEHILGLEPYRIHYKIADDDFLVLCKNIITDKFGSCDYELWFSSGTDNCLQIFGTGDLIFKIFNGSPTRIQELHSSYYILKFILDNLFGKDRVASCTTSYRNNNKLYVEIEIIFSVRYRKDESDNLEGEDALKYLKITKQLSILEQKRGELFIDRNKD